MHLQDGRYLQNVTTLILLCIKLINQGKKINGNQSLYSHIKSH